MIWGPSTMKSPAYNEWAREMTKAEMDEVSESFAQTAVYSKESGFDGAELHYSHGYLHQQFLSYVYNKRTDEYGGSLENIVRFPIETIERVREAACPDYVSATAGTYAAHADQIPPGDYTENWLVKDGARMRKAIRGVNKDVPMFIVGQIVDAERAEELVANGATDMVAMTRTQIADPAFANKVKEGREDEINHCIRCNQGCIARLMVGNAISCVVNPAAGREQVFGEHTLQLALKPASWLVVGGGPAGMKAALTLQQRGHQVTLIERNDNLGGQVNYAAQLPRREKFGFIPRDLERQLNKAGVDIRLNTNWSANEFPGIRQTNVLSVMDVLDNPSAVGKNVVLFDEDGVLYALGAAEFMLDQGHKVHLVSRFNALSPNLALTLDLLVNYQHVFRKGLEYTTNSWVRWIEGERTQLFNLFTDDDAQVLEADTFVMACGHRPENALYGELKGRVHNLHCIGDAQLPRPLQDVIYEGMLAGRELLDNPDRFIEHDALEDFDGSWRTKLL